MRGHSQNEARRGYPGAAEKNGSALGLISAADLMGMDFGEVRWAVPRILPEGVTLLGGKPKMGKSWMALDVGIAIASGGYVFGKIPVDAGDVLYLALEDHPRRLQKRLKKRLQGSEAPSRLALATACPKVGEGLEQELDKWLNDHPEARLVIIDTLKKIRPHASGNRSVYDVDYESLAPLLTVAGDHGVSILVIHHLRQLPADDPLDELSGSTGLTAVVDGALILKRDRGKADAYLHVTGRDIEEEQELALVWDQTLASWTLEGDAEDFRRSAEQQRIIELLRTADGPMGPKEVSDALDRPYGSIRVMMPKMLREGLLENPSYGKYSLTSINTTNTINSSNSVNGINNEPELGYEGVSDVNGVNGVVGTPSVSVEEVGEELRRSGSGPAKMLAAYLQKPLPQRLMYLTCAVLTARGMDADEWEPHAEAVAEAAKDPANHPLDCECEGCC